MNVIAFVLDGNENKDIILKAEKEMNLKFDELLVDKSFNKEMSKYIIGTPYSLYVDKYGNIVKEVQNISLRTEKDKDEFKNLMEKEIQNIIGE